MSLLRFLCSLNITVERTRCITFLASWLFFLWFCWPTPGVVHEVAAWWHCLFLKKKNPAKHCLLQVYRISKRIPSFYIIFYTLLMSWVQSLFQSGLHPDTPLVLIRHSPSILWKDPSLEEATWGLTWGVGVRVEEGGGRATYARNQISRRNSAL